jgi:uncharacterized BrkB/YihY/UPF0761 family membrane protein
MAVESRPRVDARRACWVVAIVTYGILDVSITVVAVSGGMATEAHPLAAAAVRRYGVWTLPVWKALAVAAFVALYRRLPRTYDLGVPIGLAVVGSAALVWNVAVLLAVL